MFMIIIGTPQKVPLILGNPHVEGYEGAYLVLGGDRGVEI